MTNLTPDKILQRTHGVSLQFDSIQNVRVFLNNLEITCSNHCLSILEAFAQPTSIRQAMQKLSSNGTYDWINLTGALTKLYNFGALREPSEIKFVPSEEFWSFGSSPAHISMLNDRPRTDKFIKAISEIVKEGDVVVEIGTGTGVLAIAAARAGAAKVFTIEAGAMAPTAQKIIDSTEIAEKIQLIRGWSPQVELPEKADVLIGEIIGNDPFAESVLQAFKDARQRFLKPDARIIPNRVKVYGLPVELSKETLKNRILTEEHLDNWKNWYNIDFSPLTDNLNYKNTTLLNLKPEKAMALNILGEPILIAEIDFYSYQESTIQKIIASKLSKTGNLNGILVYFELELGSQVITTDPYLSGDDNSWLNPVWYLSGNKTLTSGDQFNIEFFFNGKRSEFSLKEQ